ncbi:unnamed protein product, partial [Allacma fusca]
MEMLMSIETVVRSRRTGENLPLSFYPGTYFVVPKHWDPNQILRIGRFTPPELYPLIIQANSRDEKERVKLRTLISTEDFIRNPSLGIYTR